MTFARDEALANKREELDNCMMDLIGVGSCIGERELQLNANRERESTMQRESAQLRSSLLHAQRQQRRG